MSEPSSHDTLRVTAAVAEFQALRAEIIQRLQSQQALYALCVLGVGTLIGAGLAGSTPHPGVLLCVPFVTSAVGLAYADHTRRIFRIGDYIRETLWPYLDERVAGGLPSWESDFEGTMTIRTPFQAMLSTAYLATLFVFIPLAANLYAALAQHWHQSGAAWVLWSLGVLTTVCYVGIASAVGLRFDGH